MRKIIPSLIKLSVVLMVLSIIGQQVSATKGDVERALELLKQARTAIGGENAVGSVQTISLTGKSTRQIHLPDRQAKELNGEFEMHMVLPDRLIKMEKIGSLPEGAGERLPGDEAKDVRVKDVRVKIISDADTSEIENAMRQHENQEMAHYMLGLLLTPPPSFNAAYNYLGEGNVEGARADIIEAQGANGFAMKIFLDKSTHLPLMMSYQGTLPRIPLGMTIKDDGAAIADGDKEVLIIRKHKDGDTEEAAAPNIMFKRNGAEGDAIVNGDKFTLPAPLMEKAEIQIRFSDYRAENGVLLPHTLTQVVGGSVDSVWTVERYDINSPSTNEKFQKGFQWRTKQD